METYSYSARDIKTGQRQKAELQAENETMAAKLLTDRGLVPLEITLKHENGGLTSIFRRVPTKQKVIFSRQLATLVNAGLPLVQSLNNVRLQTSNARMREVISQVVTSVESGSTLADAMSKYPQIFDSVYVNLVAAGETSGTLDVSLERHADQQERDTEIVAKVRGALIYPGIIMVVLTGLVTFMVTTILPQVQNLYSSLPGAHLPLPTRVLLSVSHLLVEKWWLIILVFIGLVYLVWRWSQTPSGISAFDRFKLTAWLIGPLFTRLYMARFARTGGTLIASGVPLIRMLNVTSQAVGNVHIAEVIDKSAEQVKGGKALSLSLQNAPYFPELVGNMINTGEQSGQLDKMMSKLADYYEKELDNQVKQISTLIEPILMVIVGIVVLFVVAAVLLPIYSLTGRNLLTGPK